MRQRVVERAKNICEYCLIPPTVPGIEHQIEHILPIKHGGISVFENLAFSCIACNSYKGTDVGSFDFETDGKLTRFFNPRKDTWAELFQIREDGTIETLSAEARVTVKILKFNDEERCEERRELIEAGLY